MIELPEKSKFALEVAEEGLFYPVHEESMDFNFMLYEIASGSPEPSPKFYKKFACVYGEKINKHPLEILQKLKRTYFLSAFYDFENFKEIFPNISRFAYLKWTEKQIKMIDEARFL